MWAFMDDINEIRKLGLPTNEKTKIGYYRAVIVGIQSGGNFVRVHWLSLGINNVDQNWYNIKRLRLWRPAATAVALFVFLESGGKHMITMPRQEPTSNAYEILQFAGSIAAQVRSFKSNVAKIICWCTDGVSC